jgi:hypothetical protein
MAYSLLFFGVEWYHTTAGGIPKEEIVLAFYRPERRAITGFAVA